MFTGCSQGGKVTFGNTLCTFNNNKHIRYRLRLVIIINISLPTAAGIVYTDSPRSTKPDKKYLLYMMSITVQWTHTKKPDGRYIGRGQVVVQIKAFLAARALPTGLVGTIYRTQCQIGLSADRNSSGTCTCELHAAPRSTKGL